MDGTQENKLIGRIKEMICQQIDENRHDIIRDYERAEKEAGRAIWFPLGSSAKFIIVNNKVALKCKTAWGVKRSMDDMDEFSLGKDLVDMANESGKDPVRKAAKEFCDMIPDGAAVTLSTGSGKHVTVDKTGDKPRVY